MFLYNYRRHRSREYDDDRDFNRDDRPFKDRNRNRNSRDRRPSREREDRDRFYDNFDRRGGANYDDRRRPGQQWGGQGPGYYTPSGDMQPQFQNRYGRLVFLGVYSIVMKCVGNLFVDLRGIFKNIEQLCM